MSKTHLAVLFLGLFIGGITGYIAGQTIQSDTSVATNSLHTQLQTISHQLSDLRHSDRPTPQWSIEPQQGQTVDYAYLVGELYRSVSDIVHNALKAQLQEEFSILQRHLRHNMVAPSQTENAYDATQSQADLAQANSVLNHAISQGMWTRYDKQAFDDALSGLSGNALVEAQRKLAVAINNGDIVLAGDTTLF